MDPRTSMERQSQRFDPVSLDDPRSDLYSAANRNPTVRFVRAPRTFARHVAAGGRGRRGRGVQARPKRRMIACVTAPERSTRCLYVRIARPAPDDDRMQS